MRMAGEKVKQVHDVARELRIARQQAKVDIQARVFT